MPQPFKEDEHSCVLITFLLKDHLEFCQGGEADHLSTIQF